MNKENLANGFIDGSLSDTATSVGLKAGYVAYQPTTPYFATITPFGELSTKANSEIVQVTNKSGDTLTIVRGQRGTTAKNFSDGAIFSNGIYVEDLNTKEDSSNKSTNTSLGASNTLYPTQNAVKAYVDNKVSGLDVVIESGVTSTTAYYIYSSGRCVQHIRRIYTGTVSTLWNGMRISPSINGVSLPVTLSSLKSVQNTVVTQGGTAFNVWLMTSSHTSTSNTGGVYVISSENITGSNTYYIYTTVEGIV